MRIMILLFGLMLSLGPAAAQDRDERAILGMLKAQEDAWNKGDLVQFMKGYWEHDSLMFIGKKGPTYGYGNTLNSYLKGYPDEAHRGKFTSTVLSMKRLSDDYFFVLGRWELKRSAGDASGHYTLLIRKIRGEWLIVADHSS